MATDHIKLFDWLTWIELGASYRYSGRSFVPYYTLRTNESTLKIHELVLSSHPISNICKISFVQEIKIQYPSRPVDLMRIRCESRPTGILRIIKLDLIEWNQESRVLDKKIFKNR